MDYWSLRGISAFVALLGIGTAFALLAGAGLNGRQKISAAILAAVVGMGVTFSSRPLFASIYSQLEYKKDYGQPGTQLADLVEMRSGVVTVDADGAIFGGGALTVDDHRSALEQLQRAFVVSLMHPQPEQVLAHRHVRRRLDGNPGHTSSSWQCGRSSWWRSIPAMWKWSAGILRLCRC